MWREIGRWRIVHAPAAEAGEYANKVLRLKKSIYGLKSASKAFMKQLGEEVLKFVERVECKCPGDNNVRVQNAKSEET